MTHPQEPSTISKVLDFLALFITLALTAVAVWNEAWDEAIFWGLAHVYADVIRRREGR